MKVKMLRTQNVTKFLDTKTWYLNTTYWFDRKPHQFGLYIFISVILEKDPHNISVLKLEMRHALDQFRGIVDRRLPFLQRENRDPDIAKTDTSHDLIIELFMKLFTKRPYPVLLVN